VLPSKYPDLLHMPIRPAQFEDEQQIAGVHVASLAGRLPRYSSRLHARQSVGREMDGTMAGATVWGEGDNKLSASS
jgi:hypothetical protein